MQAVQYTYAGTYSVPRLGWEGGLQKQAVSPVTRLWVPSSLWAAQKWLGWGKGQFMGYRFKSTLPIVNFTLLFKTTFCIFKWLILSVAHCAINFDSLESCRILALFAALPHRHITRHWQNLTRWALSRHLLCKQKLNVPHLNFFLVRGQSSSCTHSQNTLLAGSVPDDKPPDFAWSRWGRIQTHHFITKTGRQADTATGSSTSTATITFHLTHPDSDWTICNYKFTPSFLRWLERTAHVLRFHYYPICRIPCSPQSWNKYSQ